MVYRVVKGTGFEASTTRPGARWLGIDSLLLEKPPGWCGWRMRCKSLAYVTSLSNRSHRNIWLDWA